MTPSLSSLEQFLNQIHMGHDHAPAAVSFASKLVHGVTGRTLGLKVFGKTYGILLPIPHFIIQHLQVALPHVSNDLGIWVSHNVVAPNAIVV